MLRIDDPFIAKISYDVVQFLRTNDKGFLACSIDVKYRYYSMPQSPLLTCAEECIESFGVLPFQTKTGISAGGFLELLPFYLKSTHVECNGDVHHQKKGVCIGSCLTPILNDIFMPIMINLSKHLCKR